MGLLPLDEVRRRLPITGQSYGGIRAIPLERIIGSVDRSADFAPGFEGRRPESRARMARLRRAFADDGMPAIEVFEVGGAYFVSDGHHRVALARERGAGFIDAAVTRLHTDRRLPSDVDVLQLVHTHQQRLLFEASGLARARPGLRIEFARPRGYAELLESIKAHGYDLARARGALPPAEEVAADWHDEVWLPGVAAMRRAGLPERYPFKTEADLFLWVYERRRDLRAFDPSAGFDEAAAYVAREGVGRRDRRIIERERAAPLPERERPAQPDSDAGA